MRRYFAGALLLVLLGQSSGVALAETPSREGGADLSALMATVSSTVLSSRLYAVVTGSGDRYAAMHAPIPTKPRVETTVIAADLMRKRPALRPQSREGVRQIVIMPDRSALDPRHRRLDPLAMKRSTLKPGARQGAAVPPSNAAVLQPLQVLINSVPRGSHALVPPKQGTGISHTTLALNGTGIEHWWTYEERPIPGIGKAMVNVGTGNYLVSAMDVDIPEQGIDLAFQRVYNSQSLHDANGDDGGDPSIFGNRWTNNLDASIIYDPSTTTITVYDLDGSACTYTSNGSGGWVPCAGEYATLAPTDGTDCTYAWTKTNGTVYWFHAEGGLGTGCNIPQAKKGQIQEIFARNQNNAITFAYSYNGTGKTSEDITEIDANHSDGDSLVMKFGLVPGTSINELSTVTRPDGATLQYLYDTSGNLVEVDKPGNNSASSVPNPPHGHAALPTGDVPETYAYASGSSTLASACGPRCTAAMWSNPNNPTDGGTMLFAANSSNQLTSWQFQGILNFTPADGTSTALQSGPSTGFVTWYTANFVYGQGSACSNTTSGTTTLCDSDGHSSIWTIDSSYRVSQTQEFAGTAEALWITTTQGWDTNNDLTSTTDANGNTTKYAYDSTGNGNMVETQLPSASDISNGPLSPLSYYSYDNFHNVTSYCDPVYNQTKGNSWVNTPSNGLCPGGQNTTAMTYATPSPEPYGCLTSITKPSGYASNISYTQGTGVCGIGLPNQVQAAQSITQYDNSTRQPTQDFTYDGSGNLTNYDKGTGSGGALQQSWTLSYNRDNLVVQKTENDSQIQNAAITSASCYYADGSLFYTETPSQWANDGDPSCPTTATMLGGGVSAPQHATAYSYDLDGDQIKLITHKGCSSLIACPSAQSITSCTGSGSNPIGTTCKYYDGLDRLVETAEPYDTRNISTAGGPQPYEFYAFRWMNRYIYDLSGSGGSANLHIADSTGTISSIVAYGDLYKTEEYLPQPQGMLASLSHGQYQSGGWNDIRGSSFDGLDRVVSKYELAYGTGAVTTNTYDCSGQYDLQCQTQNGDQQVTTYTYDSIARVKQLSFSGASPRPDGPRNYTYDADGRAASITGNTMGTLSYTYDVDGNKTSVTEPGNENAASLICYSYYADGLREYLGIGIPGLDTCGSITSQANPSNGGIRQSRLFQYSYRNDGLLATQLVNWNGIQINQQTPTFSWVYKPSGREYSETDPLAGQVVVRPLPFTSNVTLGSKTYTYDAYGRVSNLVLPETFQESSFAYDADDELVEYSGGYVNQTGMPRPLTLNARGELLEDLAQAPTYSANGTELGDGNSTAGYHQEAPNGLQLDVRSGMITAITNPFWGQDSGINLGAGAYVYSYDGAGRQVTATQYPNWPQTSGQTSAYATSYDAENHIYQTGSTMNFCSGNGGSCNLGTATAQWGPDGRQRVATLNGTTYTAHWDGDALLFYAGGGGSAELYVGKYGTMDVSGDVYISDRDQTGEQLSAHGVQSATNWFDSWNMGTARTVFLAKIDQSKSYNLFQVDGSCGFTYTNPQNQQTYYPCPFHPQFAMHRADGYNMIGGYVQGVRTYDPTSGQWLTPDAYAGDVHDPMSQKPFMWNNNNPVEWSDPSGYCPVCLVIVVFYLANAPEINAAVQDFVEGEAGAAGVSGAARSTAEREVELSTSRVAEPAAQNLLKPGPYAGTGVPLRSGFRPNAAQRASVNELGNRMGCHSCGTRTSGTSSGNWITDHQQPSGLNQPRGEPGVGLPHCARCSARQGPAVKAAKKAGPN